METLQVVQVKMCPTFVVLIIIKHNQLLLRKLFFPQPDSGKAYASRELSGNCVTAGFKALVLKTVDDESISFPTPAQVLPRFFSVVFGYCSMG